MHASHGDCLGIYNAVPNNRGELSLHKTEAPGNVSPADERDAGVIT